MQRQFFRYTSQDDEYGVPYFTVTTLRQACAAARRRQFDQTIARDDLSGLPRGGRFPVIATLRHDPGAAVPHIRCLVELPHGVLVQDVPDALFGRLPRMRRPAD
jgi:hypothetical protein